MRFENRILLLSLCGGTPAVAAALSLLWHGGCAPKVFWVLALAIVGAWLGFSFAARAKVIYPLRSISNLAGALREGDYSLRASGASREDVLGEVLRELNALGDFLRSQRLGEMEARVLLQRLMDEIDIAAFVFDRNDVLRSVNHRGTRLLRRKEGQILGRPALEMGLAACLKGDTPRIIDVSLPGASGRWELRRGAFRQEGAQHTLLILSDLTRALHAEEREAWKRLIQILRHEMNNTLAPISSIGESLKSLLAREPRPADWEQDLREGLEIVTERSEALHRFIQSYSQLTRLPAPVCGPINVGEWVKRAAGLESRLAITVQPGPDVTIQADGDLLDQLLINLVRNAADAALEAGKEVVVGWDVSDDLLQVWVEDNGPGLADHANLFVPFYTSKPHGAGIGLALSRQIAEAHAGNIALKNRQDGPGCRALVSLPLGT